MDVRAKCVGIEGEMLLKEQAGAWQEVGVYGKFG